jgi:hypothetical protein
MSRPMHIIRRVQKLFSFCDQYVMSRTGGLESVSAVMLRKLRNTTSIYVSNRLPLGIPIDRID